MDKRGEHPKRQVKDLKVKGTSAVCDEHCGCPSPCPGAIACRCAAGDTADADGHRRCSCGEHCGCNPCSCCNAVAAGTGKGSCKCREVAVARLGSLKLLAS